MLRVFGGLVILSLFLVLGYKTFNGPEYTVNKPYSSLIRIERKDGVYCSAVVFSNKYAVTAAHCLVSDEEDRLLASLNGPVQFKVFDARGKDTGIYAVAKRASAGLDIGVITGDFSQFKKSALNTEENSFDRAMGHLMVACGFGLQSETPYCHNFTPKSYFFFAVIGEGRVVPGMSGGGVFDKDTGNLVAIISGMKDVSAIVIPVQGIVTLFGLSEG